MNDDYLLVRIDDLRERDNNPAFLRSRAERLRKDGDRASAMTLDAVANAYVLRDAPFVRDYNCDVWERQDDGSYCREQFGGTLGSLVRLAGKYGPLTPCEALPVEPAMGPDELFTIVAVRGGDGTIRRFVLVNGEWVRSDGRTFTDWADVVDSGEVLSVTPPPEVP